MIEEKKKSIEKGLSQGYEDLKKKNQRIIEFITDEQGDIITKEQKKIYCA